MVPGVRFAERQIFGVEKVVMRQLSERIEHATGEVGPGTPEPNGSAPAAEPFTPSPGDRLERLLRRSMDQTPGESHASLVELVLSSIVPDEARILAALSDGSVYLVIHVDHAPRGRTAERVLTNASDVGRRAGVALPDRVPAYVTHLLQLGLVEIGPEAPGARDEYEILATDATVRHARTVIGEGRMRIVRRTLRASEIGLEFWRTCRPGD